MDKFVSKPYSINPEAVKYDTKLVEFNQVKTNAEYLSLYKSISKDGQIDPIFMKDGLCGNGRHRAKIAAELGRQVVAIDINPKMSDKAYLELCNKDTFTARNDSPTQLAIKAYNMTKDYGYEDSEAMATLGITNRNAITYVRFIDNSRFAYILSDLSIGNKAKVGNSYTKSIDVAKRKIAKIIELEQKIVVENTENQVVIDYNKLINTESGIEWFWLERDKFELAYGISMKYETAVSMVELANYKFRKEI